MQVGDSDRNVGRHKIHSLTKVINQTGTYNCMGNMLGAITRAMPSKAINKVCISHNSGAVDLEE